MKLSEAPFFLFKIRDLGGSYIIDKSKIHAYVSVLNAEWNKTSRNFKWTDKRVEVLDCKKIPSIQKTIQNDPYLKMHNKTDGYHNM